VPFRSNFDWQMKTQQALGITDELTVITERVDNFLVLIASLEKLALAVLPTSKLRCMEIGMVGFDEGLKRTVDWYRKFLDVFGSAGLAGL